MTRSETAEKIVAFLRAWDKPWCPSIEEVAQGLGLQSRGHLLNYHLVPLREQGIVDWVDGQSRTLHLVEERS